eukprot:3333487-Prymnesium_polylepis.1
MEAQRWITELMARGKLAACCEGLDPPHAWLVGGDGAERRNLFPVAMPLLCILPTYRPRAPWSEESLPLHARRWPAPRAGRSRECTRGGGARAAEVPAASRCHLARGTAEPRSARVPPYGAP